MPLRVCYTVKEGDTMRDIAEQNNVCVEDIKDHAGRTVNPYTLYPGLRLWWTFRDDKKSV